MRAFLMMMAVAWAMTCHAADKPNLSGEWKMNPAKSNYGAMAAPTSFIRRIMHAEPQITLVEEQSANGKQTSSTVSIKTDGQPVTAQINGAPVAVTGVWEENELVVTADVLGTGLKFKDRMSLSQDAKQLISKVDISSAQGNVELRIVFDHQ